MRLTRPSTSTFVVGVVLLLVGALLRIDVLTLSELDPYAFWLTFIGGAVLAAGAAFRGI